MSLNDQSECNKHKYSVELNIWKGMLNPIYLKYLLLHAWVLVQFIPLWDGEYNENILSSLNAETSDSENDDLMLFLMPDMDKYGNIYKPVSWSVMDC